MSPDTVRPDTERTPPGVRAPRAGAFDHTPTPTTTPSTTIVGEGRGGGGLVDLSVLGEQLRSRGVQVSVQSLLAVCPPDAIARTIRWWDGQETAGVGVLVETIRRGGVADRKHVGVREYADQLSSWLNEHFPEFRQSSGNPHPAAVVEVIHLHHELGRGRLLPREHASRIRAAVKAFDRKWGIV